MDVPPKDFGVVVDDDTSFVQWHVDNDVPLPPGRYLIAHPIQLRKGQSLIGKRGVG